MRNRCEKGEVPEIFYVVATDWSIEMWENGEGREARKAPDRRAQGRGDYKT
jgi:hypothetical protein